MGALWFLLHRYEGYFEDAKVFMNLVFGFFAGLFASAFETFAFGFGTPEFAAGAGIATAFIFYVAGLPFFENGIKAAIMGLKTNRNRKDTPYYGAAFGLGFGAILGMMHIALNVNRVGGIEAYNLGSFLAMVSMPIGAIFVQGATAVWVAQGVVDGKMWKGWGYATLLMIPMYLAFWLGIPQPGELGVPLLPGLFCIVYGPTLMVFAQTRILDHVVPPEIKAQLARERRRAARQEERDR